MQRHTQESLLQTNYSQNTYAGFNGIIAVPISTEYSILLGKHITCPKHYLQIMQAHHETASGQSFIWHLIRMKWPEVHLVV